MAKTTGGTDAPPAAAPRSTYVLSTPVEYNGETIKDIDYRRPKGRDVRNAFKARAAGGDMYISLLVDLCEQPEGLFDVLDGSDYIALVGICDAFLEPPKPSKAGSTA